MKNSGKRLVSILILALAIAGLNMAISLKPALAAGLDASKFSGWQKKGYGRNLTYICPVEKQGCQGGSIVAYRTQSLPPFGKNEQLTQLLNNKTRLRGFLNDAINSGSGKYNLIGNPQVTTIKGHRAVVQKTQSRSKSKPHYVEFVAVFTNKKMHMLGGASKTLAGAKWAKDKAVNAWYP